MDKRVQNLNNYFGWGKYWSKRRVINFSFLEKKKPAFLRKYYMSSLLLRHMSVFFTKSGNLSKSLNLVTRGIMLSLNIPRILNKSYSNKIYLKILNKSFLRKISKLLMKYRISGKLKQSRLSRRRYKKYYTYISFYNQLRRSIRFIAFFLRWRGNFTDKFKKEISKLKSKNFHYKRDSILFRSSRNWSGLAIKFKDNREQEDPFVLEETGFLEKFTKSYFLKYEKAFRIDRHFIKRSHPNIRRY